MRLLKLIVFGTLLIAFALLLCTAANAASRLRQRNGFRRAGEPYVDPATYLLYALPAATQGTTLMATYGAAPTFGRDSDKWCTVNGTVTRIGWNTPCVEQNGVLLEPRALQQLGSNCPYSHYGGAISMDIAGTCTLWMEGPGSLTVSGPSGCTATQGTPCTFPCNWDSRYLSASGSVTFAQFEGPWSPYPTSRMCGSFDRKPDVLRSSSAVTVPAGPWFFKARVTPEGGAWGKGGAILALGSDGSASSAKLVHSGSGVCFSVFDASGSERKACVSSVEAGPHYVTACAVADGALSLYLDKKTQTTTSAGTGTGKWTDPVSATVYLGSLNWGAQLGGWLKDVQLGKGCHP